MKIKQIFSFIVVLILLGNNLFAQIEIMTNEFLYDTASFPSCHASTLTEAENGDILVAYFGGSYEGCKDVNIYLSRKKHNSTFWENPIEIANGEIEGTIKEKKACYNPVLIKMPDNQIVLFFKVGNCVQDWKGYYSVSDDNGLSWSKKQPLLENFLGPVKNKPIIRNNTMICGSSTEKDWWKIHFELLDLNTNQWSKTDNIKTEKAVSTMEMPKGKKKDIICIQPTIFTLENGDLLALNRTKNGFLAKTTSKDNGKTWSKVTLSNIPNNNSGIDGITLQDGRHLLVYNDVQTKNGEEMGARTPLTIAIFDKDFKEIIYKTNIETEQGEFSYPSVIQDKNGKIHIAYTWNRKKIKYICIKLSE